MWVRGGQEAIPYANTEVNTQQAVWKVLICTYNQLPDTRFNLWDTFCLIIQIAIETNPHVDNKKVLLIKNFKTNYQDVTFPNPNKWNNRDNHDNELHYHDILLHSPIINTLLP